jgi:hypothetical protein
MCIQYREICMGNFPLKWLATATVRFLTKQGVGYKRSGGTPTTFLYHHQAYHQLLLHHENSQQASKPPSTPTSHISDHLIIEY